MNNIVKEKAKRIAAASGRIKPELVLKNAQIVNVFTEQLEQADVAIEDGYIVGIGTYSGQKEVDLSGKILCPGFMDGHIHVESALVTPPEYEKAALVHGTTAIFADPHEIANVSGTDGIDMMLEMSKHLTMHIYYNLPSCVPSAPLEESGCTLGAGELKPYYDNASASGLAEVMNVPGVLGCDEDLLAKIADAQEAGKNVDGHAPGLTGNDLCAYVSAGVKTDHECTSAEEAMEKVRRGQWIMIREGTAARNLETLLPLCEAPYYTRCMFVTDDCYPEYLMQEGHIDAVIRKAVAYGVPAIRALKMASFNPAQCFGLSGYGAVAPGFKADLVVLNDLKDLRVEQVYVNGKLAAEGGKLCGKAAEASGDGRKLQAGTADLEEKYGNILNSFHMSPVTASQFEMKDLKKYIRVICLKSHELLTGEEIVEVTPEQRLSGGVDLSKDIIKAAVLERHHDTGHIGVGYLKGYGLKRGAVATSVAHDSHNLIVAGVTDDDMAVAAERVRALNGGIVIAADGKVIGELPLPIGGLMSDRSVEEVDGILGALKESAAELGVSQEIDPFMTLSFVSLPVIPQLRLNGLGLVDVIRFDTVDVTMDEI